MKLSDYPTIELQDLMTAVEEKAKENADWALRLSVWYERLKDALTEQYNEVDQLQSKDDLIDLLGQDIGNAWIPPA
jgi:hypothetical protein